MNVCMLPDFANSSYTGTLPNRQVHGGADHNPAVLVEAIVVLFAFAGVTPSAMFGVIRRTVGVIGRSVVQSTQPAAIFLRSHYRATLDNSHPGS